MDFLSNISSIDETRPTLFELIAQDQLRDLLQPAIRYILAFYAERYPRYLLRIANSTDELYAVLMTVVESHFLAQYGGSFTENFYGLKRERATTIRDLSRTNTAAPNILKHGLRLRLRDRIWSIAFLVGVPYLKAKLDEQWEIHGVPDLVLGMQQRRSQETTRDKHFLGRLKKHSISVFKAAYPTVNAAYHLSSLYYSLAYMFRSSNYHSPSFALLQQRMRRLDGNDYRRIEEVSGKPLTLPPNSSLSPLVFLKMLLPRGISALKYILPLGIFFLKFLEWWQSSDFAAQMARNTSSSIELPPPVQPSAEKTEKYVQDGRLCRLCGSDIVNPTAIQTGFVFCYVCAYKWVKEKSSCPITNVKLLNGTDGLRRLMV